MRVSEVETLFSDPAVLLGFMRRTRKAVFHNSNIFYRDIQFAIRDYFDSVERRPISMPEAARMANEVIDLYTDVGILRKVNNQAYLLESPEWTTPKGGTFSMLTIHGAPLPESAKAVLELAIAETPGEQVLKDQEIGFKGGDVSPQGSTIAALQSDGGDADESVGGPSDKETLSARDVQAVATSGSHEQSENSSSAPPWLRKPGK
jgi:hypothetical protein